MKKHVRPTPVWVHIPSHRKIRGISQASSRVVFGRKRLRPAGKKFRVSIGFVDDLTAGLVEEWNLMVDGARAELC